MFNKLSIKTKLLVISLVASLLILILLTSFQYIIRYKQIEKELGSRLISIAQTTGLFINESVHRVIQEPDDYNKPEFKKISSLLNKVKKLNNLTDETIYTFQILDEHSLRFAVMLHEKPFISSIYLVPDKNIETIKIVISGKPSSSKIYTDIHGSWISGYAPIINKETNQTTGILEVDYRVEELLEELYMSMIEFIFIGFLVVIIAGFFMSIFISRFSSRIIKLKQVSEKIISGDYNINLKVNPKSEDEISDLTKAFIKMINSLKERFLMLQYISPHTKEMIEKTIKGELSAEGQLTQVTVLLSDIRGFTKFTESRTPEFVLDLLNELLGIQTTVIEKYNGYIDKFVGDEVVAVFTKKNHSEDAVKAAIEIQEEATKYINAKGLSSELALGIGINKGEVILGNMGNANRKDFTIIGSNVNLAARLTSAAKSKQILTTEDVVNDVQNLNLKTRNLGLYKFKGIKAPVVTYLIEK